MKVFKKKAPAARANTNHTLVWDEKVSKGTRQSRMRESLHQSKSSLVAENMYQAVVLPGKVDYYVENYNNPDEREEIHEWWAENTVDFYNELCVLMGVLTENNEEWGRIIDNPEEPNVPNRGYPKGVKYMWKASNNAKPSELSVDVYMDHVVVWVNSQIENENIFPTDEDVPFPDDFKTYAKKMYQRMFRLFAIFYANECLYKRKVVENHLDTCFRHFLYFCWKWDLLEANETKCIEKIITPFKTKFDRDQQMYFQKKLPLVQLSNKKSGAVKSRATGKVAVK